LSNINGEFSVENIRIFGESALDIQSNTVSPTGPFTGVTQRTTACGHNFVALVDKTVYNIAMVQDRIENDGQFQVTAFDDDVFGVHVNLLRSATKLVTASNSQANLRKELSQSSLVQPWNRKRNVTMFTISRIFIL